MAGLLVYKASAGSGKTYRLVAEYIKMLIENPQAYREILAVTFTNKATAEMKGRIIEKLYKLKKSEEPDLLQTLKAETDFNEDKIRSRAEVALSNILHDYSMFSISTIDSFVQRIIQNLLWELGQHGNNELVLEHKPYIEKASDTLLDELTKHPELFNHVKRLIEERLDENKSPNIQNDLINLGNMLFHERYKLLSSEERELMHNKETLNALKAEVNRIISEIYHGIKTPAGKLLEQIYSSGIDGINQDNYSDFFKKKGGIIPVIAKLAELKRLTPIELKSIAEDALSDISVWLTKEKISMLKGFVEQQLMPQYRELYSYLNYNYRLYNTALAINENISTLYIINELYKKLREKLNDDGVMLLSDSSALLKEFVSQTDTPFIYEKIGTKYTSYMLDEFQDTSQLQWRNFEPLIADSLGSSGLSMVVGDVKQSIYRWRNSDWRIMAGIEAERQFYPQVKQLTVNYRSARTIVEFNNHFFQKAIEINEWENTINPQNPAFNLKNLYSDVKQEVKKLEPEGYVEVAFMPPKTDEANDYFTNHIRNILVDLKDRGYRAGDIAFLVRKNEQGRQLAELLLQLSKSDTQLSGFIKIVSQDALILNSSAAVRLCVAALKIALNPKDTLAVAQFRKEFALLKNQHATIHWPSIFLPDSDDTFDWLSSIRFYPLGYMVEAIIQKYFHDQDIDINDHLPYLSLLHEYAIDFSYRGTSSLSRFIEWYEQDGKGKRLFMAETENTINILSIHKSKGLEFPIIIFPFADLQNQQKQQDSIMWFKLPADTPNEILKNYPLLPIKPKKALAQTYFEADYYDEQFCKEIDDINLQYVAFTRAKHELYILVTDKKLAEVEASKAQEIVDQNSFLKFLPNSSSISPQKVVDGKKVAFTYGQKSTNKAGSTEGKGEETKLIKHYPINPMRGKIARQFKVDSGEIDQKGDLQHGIAMHAILSKIITLDDLDEAMDWAVQNGYITANQRQNVHNSLISMINSEPYKQWFSSTWEVKNEASIVNTDGNIYRPDRVLIGDNQAVIIDFKFGLATPKHRKQVEQYKELLLSMGYERVKGYLWYFQLNRHEEV
ncbi:UvrD-helicase domain-containing protein [Tenuifilum osseticum]|uniref:UvrD-helicase domain-containing protein n=1 Tax=Tenuifilum osseticum TaxID=3374723 RepID=UPI0034E40F02